VAKGKDQQHSTTAPQQLPETTPHVYPGANYDFSLQAIFEMQNSLGKLTNAIERLIEDNKTHAGKLDKINHKISVAQGVLWACLGVLAIMGGIMGFVVNKFCDVVLPLIQFRPHP